MTTREKCCRRCDQTKPLTAEFWQPRKDGKDGFRSTCRLCRSEQHRETNRRYYRRNADQINAEKRSDYATNPEKYRVWDRTYRERNQERRRKHSREWYWFNRDYVLQWKRERYWADAEVARRRAREDRERHLLKRRASQNIYYWANRDRLLAKMRERRQANQEHFRLLDFASRLRNREKRIRRDRDYYRRHRERILARNAAYRRQMPVRIDRADGKPTERVVDLVVWRNEQERQQAQAAAVEILVMTMQALTEVERRLLLAFEVADYDLASAASALGLPSSTAETLMKGIRNAAIRARIIASAG